MIIFILLSILKKDNSSEELELMRRISNKDENALSELYDSYSRILYSLIIKIVKRQEDAEEILQTIFLQVWDKAEKFNKEKGNVYSWLVVMARNKSIDKIRSKSYKKELSTNYNIENLNLADSGSSGMTAVIAEERSENIFKALDQLPDEQKEVIKLAYFEGYTQTEISEMIKVPVGTVKTRTRTALMKLENLLKSIL